MTDWITDRQPTEADTDHNGEVAMRRFADGRLDSIAGSVDAMVDWRHVGAGVPWRHTSLWKPRAEPAKAVKPALAVGQRWRRRDGEEVTISEHDTSIHGALYPFRADGHWPCGGGHWYRADGTSCINVSQVELVELIEPAAEPQPERCSTCRFAQPSWDDALRSCHHNPPQIGPRGAEWPTVNANAWCGAYERRTDG